MAPYRLLALPVLQLGSFVMESWAAMRGDAPHSEVPAMESSLASIAEAVLDRSFTLGVNLMAGVPGPDEVREAWAATRRARAAVEAEGWLDDPLSFHATPPAVGDAYRLEAKRGFQAIRALSYQELSFESGYVPQPALPEAARWLDFENNRQVHAYVLEHEGEPDRPWVVCVHGFGMGTPLANFPGFNVHHFHHELGLNVAMPCLPLHGPRATSTMSGGDIMSPDFLNLVHVFAQAVWDIRRTLRWVRERGGERIGLWGVSLGGYTSAIVAALEAELACVIAGIPPTDFANVARDNQPLVMRGYERELSLDWDAVRTMMHVVSPLSVSPVLPRERRFIYAGIADRVVRPDQARALWRHWERPQILWFAGGHVASQWKRDVIDFVDDSLRESGVAVEQA